MKNFLISCHTSVKKTEILNVQLGKSLDDNF